MPRQGRYALILIIAIFCLAGGSARAARNRTPARGPVAGGAGANARQAPASENWNSITIALDTKGRLARASDLLAAIPGATTVMRWSAVNQTFERTTPGADHPDFALKLGEPVFVALDGRAGSTFTLTGDVPPPGTVTFDMRGGSPCQWHHVSLPLEMGAVTNAQQLAEAIRGADDGAVEQLLRWEASIQNFVYWVPAPVGGAAGLGSNFPVRIGGDYFVCLRDDARWP